MVVLLLIGASVVGIYLYGMTPATTSSNTTSASAVSSSGSSSNSGARWFRINYDNLTVGYNSGLWSISISDVGGVRVKHLTAILATPVESRLCTGALGGFYFSNCTPTTYPDAGYFPANATFSGFASGAGPGSAKPGKAYTVTLAAVFADGTARNDTITVMPSGG